jgi:transposase
MHVIYPRCCGLDVHQRTVVAYVLITEPDGQVQRRVRTFATMTAELLALGDWLRALQVTHVAIESTGVYWRPVFNVLEADDWEIVLVNAQHLRRVPGRKTDVADAEWLADLLRHGLVRPSFIPPKPIRDLREVTRYRATLIQQRTQEINHLHKVLETGNIKLAVVATDVLGTSGRDMLAELARGRLRAKLAALRQALDGRLQPHQRALIGRILAHVDFINESVLEVQAEIDRQLASHQEAIELLDTIPGVGPTAAATIVAEIGVDMGRFPTAKHLASWAGVCPGNKQSGGKRLSGKATKGNRWLRAMLGEVAWVISRTKDNYLAAQYHRLARRRGKPKAAMAVAHSVLVIAYHLLRTKQPYRDLGADYFDSRQREQIERHHVNRLKQLGYEVTLTPGEAA